MLELDITILQTKTAGRLIKLITRCLPYIKFGVVKCNSVDVSLLEDINYTIGQYNKSRSKVVSNKTRVGNRLGRPKK